MRKKKKPAEISPLPETYICPICGESHKHEELCPIVLNRRNKIKYNSLSYIMGGILLECLEREVDFFQIIKEITYFMEELSLRSPFECISFNADFIISYFASAIGCSPFRFYKKLPELALKYDMYIDNASSLFDKIDSVEVDEHNNIIDLCMALDNIDGKLGDMLENAGYFHPPQLYVHKVFNGRKPTYHLVMNYQWVETGRCRKQNSFNNTNDKPVFQVSNFCFAEHTSLDGFELYAEKEGKLKEIFEADFELELEWENVADKISCSKSVAYEWTLKLDEATKKGLLRWDKSNRDYGIKYFTTYDQAKIEIYIANDIPKDDEKGSRYKSLYSKGDYIRVYETDRKMYHYGEVPIPDFPDLEFLRKDENEDTAIIQEPMLRRVASTVDRWEDVKNSFIESRTKRTIRKTDVLSVAYSFVCSEKGHLVVPCCGLVSIITPDGEKIEDKVYLGYCRNCDVYYIFRRDYENLCKKGTLQCKVVDAITKKILSDASFNFNEKSVLSEMGYNVQASEDLSSAERHRILKTAIEDKKIPVNEIINLLELQINLHSGNEKYANAVEKWKEDSDFVKSYGINSGRNKRIHSIQV